MADERDTIIGIDVGGTFTDVFLMDHVTGDVRVGKVASTRGDESRGFMNGVASVVDDMSSVGAIVHGTTVGTNALLERKGATTGVITTEGFADVLEMRRRDRPRTWGLSGDFVPVVDRDMRLTVRERVRADGTIEHHVDPSEASDKAQRLVDKGAQAVAVVLLHSYANPANEEAVARAVRSVWPNAHVSVSSEILPEIREFERSSTTVLNAYLQPVVGDYLAELEKALANAGFAGTFLVVQSNGGVMTATQARSIPIRTALSGPAAGVIAAQRIAARTGRGDILTGDMGGTSFDVAVVADGRTIETAQTTIDFGLVVRSPMIEMSTIGAGGGSIAWVDRGGLLRIGPESAGGVPGPVCYGNGNERPTVTDANVVLGRINPDRPIGGRSRLDVDAARRAIETHIGIPLGVSIEEAADAVVKVAETKMAGALRLVSIERGHDPSRFWMVPFGGAGALHTCSFVRSLSLAGALVPRFPGVISALGCVLADMRHDTVQSLQVDLTRLDIDDLRSRVDHATVALRVLLDESGVPFSAIERRIELDMAYQGQTHSVSVPLEVAEVAEIDRSLIAAEFERAYSSVFGRILVGPNVRVLAVRTTVIGRRPEFDLSTLAGIGGSGEAEAGRRDVYFGGQWHSATIWNRLSLAVGQRVSGPCVLEQPDATTFVEPGFVATADEHGNVVLEMTT